MSDQSIHDKLRACLTTAGSNVTKKQACERAFVAAGGKVEGGKVFSTPDDEATFATNGGKVFACRPYR